jgi:protein ImuB
MPAPGTPPRTLVVWCPDWAVTAAACPPAAAVAVVSAQRVIACSAAARASGVRAGQRRREAQSCCPGLTVLAGDPGGEVRAFEPVVRALEGFGVPVAVRRAGWAALRTRGPARRHGGELPFAAAVAAVLAGCLPPGSWRIGLADGPFAATIAAKVLTRTGDTGYVAAGGNAGFLAPLAIELIGRPELADLLRRLGITTLGAFAGLAVPDVLARFGPDGARAHELAAGLDERRLEGRRVPPELTVVTELDPPAERVDEAAFAARSLAASLCEGLSSGGLACTRLALEVRLSGGEQLRRVWEQDGSWTASLVAERLRLQLEAWLTAGGGGSTGGAATGGCGVESLRLEPLEVVPDRGRQSGLWGRSQAGEERVLRAATRLQGMLGPAAVLRPVLVGGRGPADRVRLVPFGDPVPDQPSPAPWPGCLPAPSPAVVAGEGEAVELLDATGERVAVDGRGALSAAPATLAGARGNGVVVAWSGPWPADERWWDPAHHRRRARLQVLTAAGEGYLVALEHGGWRLEGIYD